MPSEVSSRQLGYKHEYVHVNTLKSTSSSKQNFTQDSTQKSLYNSKIRINKPKTTLLSYTSYLSLILLFTLYPQFLSIIWPTLLTIQSSQILLFILTATFINLSIFIGYSSIMYFVYIGKYSILEKYRISQELWPWEVNSKQWRILVEKTLLNVFVNICIIAPILAYIDCSKAFPIKMSLQQISTSPTLTYIWQFTFFLLCNQIWSYLMHALLHHPILYWIHKSHHQYAIPVSISGMYVHPLQYILSSSISTCIGYKILSNWYPVHIFSFIIWLTFRNLEINDSHSGYNWPWAMTNALPFGIDQGYHYYHHRRNLGNFGGILTVIDDIFKTNKQYYQFCADVQKDAKKDNHREKGMKENVLIQKKEN